MRFLFLLFFFFLVQSAHAGSIFDVLDGQYIDSVSELPQSDGIPDQNIQKSGHIEGWIDITGYRQMVREDGIDYVLGSPADYAIVQNDVWGYFAKGQKCYSCAVEKIQKDISVTTSGNYTIATMKITLFWYEVLCDQNSCWEEHYVEKATFSDSEIAPQTYDVHIENLTAHIVEYNNSIAPKTSILVDIPLYISKMEYRYDDNLTVYRSSIGTIEKTRKGIYFMNISRSSTWEMKGMSRMGNHVIIKSANISYPLLKLTAYTFFEEKEITDYNITRIDYTPETTWHPFLFYFAGLLAIFSAGTYKLIRRLRL